MLLFINLGRMGLELLLGEPSSCSPFSLLHTLTPSQHTVFVNDFAF